jgi:hypothetical protein
MSKPLLHLFVLCVELRSICTWNFKAILMPMSKCRRTCKVYSLWILDLLVYSMSSNSTVGYYIV